MGKRLSDTVALQDTPFSGKNNNEYMYKSQSIRKIDNGYIVRTDDGTSCTEVFSESHPDSGTISAKTDSMKRAVDYMKKG